MKTFHAMPPTRATISLIYKERDAYYFHNELMDALLAWEFALAIPDHKLCLEVYNMYSKHRAFFDLPRFGFEMLKKKAAILSLKLSTRDTDEIYSSPEVLCALTDALTPMSPHSQIVPDWYASQELINLVETAKDLYVTTMEKADAYGIFADSYAAISRYQIRHCLPPNISSASRLRGWVSDMIDLFFWGYGPIGFKGYPVDNCQPVWGMATGLVLELMNDNPEDRQLGNNLFARAAQEEFERNTQE